MAYSKLTIVDEHDQVIGAESFATARAKGLIHRIARVFIFNSNGQILIHRRKLDKIDSPGKWDQSVGGHVDEGESYEQAALRETSEELGIRVHNLQEVGRFYSDRQIPNGQVKRFHTVFVAHSDEPIKFSTEEIAEIRLVSPQELNDWYQRSPQDFTNNFGDGFELVCKKMAL